LQKKIFFFQRNFSAKSLSRSSGLVHDRILCRFQEAAIFFLWLPEVVSG
jgi:hypothetical protein